MGNVAHVKGVDDLKIREVHVRYKEYFTAEYITSDKFNVSNRDDVRMLLLEGFILNFAEQFKMFNVELVNNVIKRRLVGYEYKNHKEFDELVSSTYVACIRALVLNAENIQC